MKEPNFDPRLQEAVAFLDRFQFHGYKLGLERMEAVLEALSHPQRQYPVIHVAGSNGKGSTCAALTSIFSAAGLKTGFYSSPHLFRLNERFRIGDEEIPDGELAEILLEIKELVEQGYELSYFEYTTTAALLWFARRQVDLAILETGLGGRLDATNVVEQPLVSVITTISLEHQHWLGDTIEEIAWEKAGIIKPGCPVVSTVKDERAAEVIRRRAFELASPIHELGAQIEIEKQEHETFDLVVHLPGGTTRIEGLEFSLPGPHQKANAAAAAAAALIAGEALGVKGDDLERTIRAGLATTAWPCRCELFSTAPDILLDGAHNHEGLEALEGFLGRLTESARDGKAHEEKLLLWACSNEGGDKDFAALLGLIAQGFDSIWITEPPGPRRPVTIEEWQEAIAQSPWLREEAISLEASWQTALDKALRALSPNGLLLVAGSLYLAGAVRHRLSSMV